jgi:hypothetical protein
MERGREGRGEGGQERDEGGRGEEGGTDNENENCDRKEEKNRLEDNQTESIGKSLIESVDVVIPTHHLGDGDISFNTEITDR